MIATILSLAFLAPGPALDTTLRIPARSSIDISSLQRPIHVTGTAGNELRVEGADVEIDGSDVSIDGDFLSGKTGPIVVHLPLSSSLTIDATQGSVTVINAPVSVEITAIDGRVEVSGGRGELSVSSIGGITVRDFAGETLSLEGLDGSISVNGATGVVDIVNVSGPIDLTAIRSRDVRVSSTDGPIRWQGDFDPAGRYRFETHDGGVMLTVSDALDAQLRLTSFDGGLATEIPAKISRVYPSGGFGEQRTTAVWGRGRASIEIATFDGGVTVRRGPQ